MFAPQGVIEVKREGHQVGKRESAPQGNTWAAFVTYGDGYSQRLAAIEDGYNKKKSKRTEDSRLVSSVVT